MEMRRVIGGYCPLPAGIGVMPGVPGDARADFSEVFYLTSANTSIVANGFTCATSCGEITVTGIGSGTTASDNLLRGLLA